MDNLALYGALPTPNTVTRGDKFHVSYNSRDADSYGCDTTALVLGEQMDRFYILKGDHEAAYRKLIPQGFDACLDYFRANIAMAHPYGDKLPD